MPSVDGVGSELVCADGTILDEDCADHGADGHARYPHLRVPLSTVRVIEVEALEVDHLRVRLRVERDLVVRPGGGHRVVAHEVRADGARAPGDDLAPGADGQLTVLISQLDVDAGVRLVCSNPALECVTLPTLHGEVGSGVGADRPAIMAKGAGVC